MPVSVCVCSCADTPQKGSNAAMNNINFFINEVFCRLESAVLFDDAVRDLYFVFGYRQYFFVIGQTFGFQVSSGTDKIPTIVPFHSQFAVTFHKYGIDECIDRGKSEAFSSAGF